MPLNSIKTLKKYCKTNLNVFIIKKSLNDEKKILSIEQIFVSNQNFTT